MKITVLAENTAVSDMFCCEHGLSLYIEVFDKKILFDMGQSSLFAENAEKLNIDLSAVDVAVISHGHYDHAGGLETFLNINSKAQVYIRKSAFGGHYNAADKYIGVDKRFENSERFVFTDDFYEIADGMTLYSCNNRKFSHPSSSAGLKVMLDGRLTQDNFSHEQYLLIKEKGKKVLFSGCSHKGILNIADSFSPDVLIGGFHFSKIDDEKELLKNAVYLDKFNTVFYTCHCTGIYQYEYMKKYMKNLFYLSSGSAIEV